VELHISFSDPSKENRRGSAKSCECSGVKSEVEYVRKRIWVITFTCLSSILIVLITKIIRTEPVGETFGEGKAAINPVRRLAGSCPLKGFTPGLGLLAMRPSLVNFFRRGEAFLSRTYRRDGVYC
jgi:hypothetical protein